MIAEGIGDHGRIRLELIVGEAGGAWKIDGWYQCDLSQLPARISHSAIAERNSLR